MLNTIIAFVIDHIEFITAILAGITALFQWKQSNNNNRAEYLDKLLNTLWENKDIQNFLLLNDYNNDWYTEEFHRSDDKTLPTIADKTLSYISYICYVVKVRIIRNDEKALFDYYINSLAQSDDLRRYIFDLYQYSIFSKKTFPFSYFLDYCIENNFINKEIKSKDYFKFILMEESCLNANEKYIFPQKFVPLKEEMSSGLFIKTCSRCECCNFYENGNCSKKNDIQQHFWIPADLEKKCSDFSFNNETWNSKYSK